MIASFCNPVRGLEILRSMNCVSFSLLRCRMYASLEMDRNYLTWNCGRRCWDLSMAFRRSNYLCFDGALYLPQDA